MNIGWIDFSKEYRQKVLSVIDLLSEEGTVDELGVSSIRDGFSHLFFPGTSTIQTRAKYFLIVPYALDGLSKRPDLNPSTLLNHLSDIERKCGEVFLSQDADGAIGSVSLRSNNWVKRAPSSIYWAGLRLYGIFTRDAMTLNEYLLAITSINKHKSDLKKLGLLSNKEHESDDKDAGDIFPSAFWKLPSYPSDWIDQLSIDLTPTEAQFLKQQIEENQPDSLLAHFLKMNMTFVTKLNSFLDLTDIGVYSTLTNQLKKDVDMASAFSWFIYGARIRYNILLSRGRNEEANQEWSSYHGDLTHHANLDIPAIFHRLNIYNPRLKTFLLTVQNHMLNRDIDGLDKTIRQREIQLKGENRAKLNQAGSFSVDQWFGGKHLDYRFNYARRIIEDIFNGLESK